MDSLNLVVHEAIDMSILELHLLHMFLLPTRLVIVPR